MAICGQFQMSFRFVFHTNITARICLRIWRVCSPRGPVDIGFSLICALINCWVNNRDAGDLRRHCTQYDPTVMIIVQLHFLERKHLKWGRSSLFGPISEIPFVSLNDICILAMTNSMLQTWHLEAKLSEICIKIEKCSFLHAKPWIPGDEKSIFTVVIH